MVKEVYGLVEPKVCCYSCIHFKRGKSRKGICMDGKYPGRTIMHVHTCHCDSYEEIELIQCEVCGLYLRSLSNHTRTHGLTVDEYKEQFGINRTTGLVCETTREKLKAIGREKCFPKLKASGKIVYGRCTTRGYKLRDEGRINRQLKKTNVKEHKPNIPENRKIAKFVNENIKEDEYLIFKDELYALTITHGVKYIYRHIRRDGVPQYRVKWGRQTYGSRYFSTQKYGEIGALIKALEYRNKILERRNENEN